MSGYSQPKAASKFDLKDRGHEYLGKLLLIWPTDVMRNVQTTQGIADTVVECDIAVIDKTDPTTGLPEYLTGVRLWWTVLVNQTKTEVGGKVLGRLGQGPNVKGNPPWLLLDYTDQDVQWAEQYEAQFPRNAPTQPSAAANGGQQAPPPQQQPQAPPWANQAPAAAPAAPPAQAPAWGQPQAAPPQQQQFPPQAQAPAAAWNAPAPAAAPPAAPPAPGPETWPPGLADFLTAKQVDITGMTEGTARQIAATYQ